MDNPLGSSGFDRSEMIPPVPAPRYKRKLITNEDSKHSSNKQNTGVSEQTTEMLPPPRRKYKSHQIQKTNNLTFLENIENGNAETNLLEKPSSYEEVQITSSGELPPNCSKEPVLEIEQRDHKLNPYKPNYLNLDEQKCSKMSEMTDAFREIVDSSILKNFINDRVLDIPLGITKKSSFICAEQTSTQDSDVDYSEENRVNSSLTENSATIVGVFYKPEYSLLKQQNEDKPLNSNVSNGLDSTVWSSSFVSDGNKKTGVLPNESVRMNNKMNKKDSEEDDSGVYFSDTKSPPHRSNNAGITNENINDDEITASSDLQFSKPFTCNDRDTFDNNSSDLGPNMCNDFLDSFEAQTVSALREQVTGRLSLCSELSKYKAVEDWLDNGEYLSKKKVINSNLSEYLKNMLEVEESERSLSPYPLSTVDESSDVCEKGPNDETEFVGQSYTLEACTVPSRLSETRENRNVDTSDKYVSSFVDNKFVNNVNSECTEVTLCKAKSISLSKSPKSNMDDIEMFCQVGELRMSGENKTSQYNLFYKETNHPISVSPSIEHGAVNKLITYFETIDTEEDIGQEYDCVCKDDIGEVTQDVDMFKQDSQLCSYTFGPVSISPNNEINTICPNIENMAVEQEEQCDSSLSENNYGEVETRVCDYLKEEKVPLGKISFSNGISEPGFEIATKYHKSDEIIILESNTSKNNRDRNFENYYFSKTIVKVEKEQPVEVKVLDFEDDPTTITTFENDQNVKCQRNSCLEICDDGIGRVNNVNPVETNIEELSPPMGFTDDNKPPAILDENLVSENNNKSYNNRVPNFNISTKDLLESDDASCSFKPTRIPIVILTEADIISAPIGSVELHPEENPSEENYSKGMTNEEEKVNFPDALDFADNDVNDCNEEESLPEDVVTVVLEKNWGSIGLKIKGDAEGVVISDVLVGGAADQSGLVFQGLLLSEKENQEQISSLKSAPCWGIQSILFITKAIF